MPPNEESSDWLGDLNWQGYPRLAPIKDVASAVDAEPSTPRPRRRGDMQAEAMSPDKAVMIRENAALRGRLDALAGLTSEFERRLSEAAQSYEKAALDSESARRAADLDNARLAGELESARAELARREARELAREADLKLERERRSDGDKALVEARRRVNDLEAELGVARSKGAELFGSVAELRRQAMATHERLLQAKTLTDQDVQLLRFEMRNFLAKFSQHIQETYGGMTPGEPQ